MKTVEKLDLLSEAHGINISHNIGKHDALKLILSSMETKEIEEFYIDTFMMLDDEITNMYSEAFGEELTDEEKHLNTLDDMGDIEYQLRKDEPDHYDLKEEVA